MKIAKLISCVILTGLISSCTTTSPREFTPRFVKGINVIPQPRQIITKEHHCVLTNDFIILLESTCTPADRLSAQILQQDLANIWKLELEIVIDDNRIEGTRRAIILGIPERDKEFKKRCGREAIMIQKWQGNQGYVLKAQKDIIVIAGNTSTGLFYGVQTLRQLIEPRPSALIVPGLVIRDWPIYQSRGIQIDISRQPLPKISYFKTIIDDLAAYKINKLMLSTQHTIRFQRHPDIAPEGALTQEELKEIIAYARDHHIELINNLESLGPMEQILGLEAYQELADDPTNPRYISPVKEASYELLNDLYDELIPLYESELFCVHCAEPAGWSINQDSVLRIGIEGVYLRHLTRLNKLLTSYKQRMLIWGDMARKYQRIIPKLPKEAIILNRDFEVRPNYYKTIQPFQQAGLPDLPRRQAGGQAGIEQFICPGTSSANEIFPILDHSLNNIQRFLRDGHWKKIKNTMLCTSPPGIVRLLERSELSLDTKVPKDVVQPTIVGSIPLKRNCHTINPSNSVNSMEANWFNIAWFSECAWLTNRSNQTHFKDKFTYSFYGAPGDEGTQLIEILNRPNQSLQPTNVNQERNSTTGEVFFWEDPFKTRLPLNIPHFSERMKTIEESSQKALNLIQGLRWKAKRHARNLDSLTYIARRWQLLARKFILAERLAQDYRHYFDEYRDQREKVTRRFTEWHNILNQISGELIELQKTFDYLWNQYYRSYLFVEHKNKFTELNKVYQDKTSALQKAENELAQTNEMPEPSTLNFQKKTFLHRIVTPSMLKPEITITKKFTWWDPDWHYRVLIKTTNQTDKAIITEFDYPLEVHLNFSNLMEEKGIINEELDIDSLRVIEYDANKYIPTKELPYQFEEGTNFNTRYHANAQLVWLIDGELTANNSRYFYIYFDTIKHGHKKKPKYKIKGLKTYPGSKGSYWVENNQMQVQLIPQGGLISQWQVKEAGRDIIDFHPTKNPLGFLEIPEYEKTDFKLTCEAQGPYLVRYCAQAPDGLTKTVNFYRHLPLCEVILDTGTYAYHNHDHPDNLMRKRKILEEAIFSNYFRYDFSQLASSPVKEKDTYWTAKKCGRDLLIGCITPDLAATHYAGWGGSDGGIGAISSTQEPITHFIIYADTTREKITTLFDNYRTVFTYVTQLQLERDKVETKE